MRFLFYNTSLISRSLLGLNMYLWAFVKSVIYAYLPHCAAFKNNTCKNRGFFAQYLANLCFIVYNKKVYLYIKLAEVYVLYICGFAGGIKD